MFSFQLIRKIVWFLLPIIIINFFKSRSEKRKSKTSFIIDKNNVEEGEIIEEKD